MRLIDADALIAKAYIMQEPNGFIHSVVTERQIVNAPTIEAATQWIPVTERLPEKTGTYIVTTQTGAVTTARFYEARSIPAQMWREAYDRPASWQSNRKVTHWMPLPEPPKDGGAE